MRLFPVSFGDLLSRLAEEAENPRLRNMKRMFNVIGVSLSLGILGISQEPLLESVGSIFAKKPQVAQINKQAAKMAYDLGATFTGFDHRLSRTEKKTPHHTCPGLPGHGTGQDGVRMPVPAVLSHHARIR